MAKSIDKRPAKLSYFESLDSVSKDRYLQKISFINKTDPYTIEKDKWSQKAESFPCITYPDIVNYLVYTPSSYTIEDLKAYKSLEAYNQLVCGWVREVSTTEIENLNVIIAKVMHSQRMNEAPLKPWVIAEKNGKVISAHCDCMAGLGEACTHVAATLFWIEATVRIRESKTVTQEKAYWLLPAGMKNVPYSKLSDIDFTSAKSKKSVLDKRIDNEKVNDVQKKRLVVETPSADELNVLFKDLSIAGSRPAILSLIPPYSEQYVPAPLSKQFPVVLTDLYKQDAVDLDFEDLKLHCDNIKITVTEEEAQNVFDATKLQHKSKMWFRFRAGRITASKMKDVCRTKLTKPSESLIKSICYPNEKQFSNVATQWGCDHEKCGIDEYTNKMSNIHENLKVSESGLFLNPFHPHLGASPDGLVVCDCCGEGCIEVKCPFCIRQHQIDENTIEKTCLKIVDGQFQLDRSHKYYYQIQTQLLVCDKEYVDFVMWTLKGLHIERIEPDTTLIDDIISRSLEFFKIGILPELTGKYYSFSRSRNPLQSLPSPTAACSSNNQSQQNQENDQLPNEFCICKGPEYGRMIQCDYENCNIVWFHFKCVKLKRAPKGSWYCPHCVGK